MFRQIVSNLPFSPTLVGQLGFYAKRLKKEEVTRRAGLIMTALALVVQSLTVFTPPEAANAATPGQVGDAPRCTVEAVDPRGQAFKVSNNVATVEFDVTGSKNCKVRVSGNAFYAPSIDGRPYDKQILYGERNTRVIDTLGRKTMRVDLPPRSTPAKGCYYQVDLTYGTYNVQPLIAYGHGEIPGCLPTPPPPPPAGSVVCNSLTIEQINATDYRFIGKAGVANGGLVQGYSFKMYNSVGALAYSRDITTTALQATTGYSKPGAGTYTVKLVINGFGGTTATGPQCEKQFTVAGTPEPAASCTNVTAAITNRNQAYFTGNAQAVNGATISGYTFIVKNSLGIEVKRTHVPTSEPTAVTSAVEISNPGEYTVQLVVQTSLGERTGDNCATKFTIAPPSVCQFNPKLPPGDPDCQPCPGDESIWIKDEKCKADIILSKTTTNLTQGNVDGTKVTAKAGDRISYTLTVENKGTAPTKTTVSELLGDVLEYAKVTHNGGGTYDEATQSLSWPEETIEPGKKVTHSIVVQVLETIPTTNTNGTSYDCRIDNKFGNSVSVTVECPAPKMIVEQTVEQLPSTGPTENLLFAGVVGSVVTFFYARSRQLGREVKLVRKEFNMGTI